MPSRLLVAGLVVLAAAACTKGGGSDGGTIFPDSGGGMDSGRNDSGAMSCTTDPDCNDSIPCTIDQCVVGNICRYTPLNEMCADGETCQIGVGCSASCATAEDCNDGNFCNGVERCIAGDCFMGDPADCDDGNICTIDTCDSDIDGCSYEVADGCDGGVPPIDGSMCEAFDPATGYTGMFRLLPTQASACLEFSFSVSEVSFSTASDTLTVRAGSITLTQSPIPTGADFAASGTSGCGSFELTGTFDCADRFSGMWRATPTGSCSGTCSSQNAPVVGLRR